MDTIKFIEQCKNQVYQRFTKTLEGLTPEQLVWRPAPHANCIAEIVLHVARGEDEMIRTMAGLGPELWESQKWREHFGYQEEQLHEKGFQFLKDGNLTPPQLEDLLDYLEALHQDTLSKLNSLTAEDLDRARDPEQPKRILANNFRHLITHTNNHHGQVDYIRGLMQPDWDLPRGTGVIQQ